MFSVRVVQLCSNFNVEYSILIQCVGKLIFNLGLNQLLVLLGMEIGNRYRK